MAFPYFWSIRLDRYNSTFGIFVLIGQVIYALFILYFLIREIRKIIREKKEYFNNSWNGVEVCIISLSIASMVFYFYRVDVGNRMIEQRKKYPQMFLNFHYLVNWDQVGLLFLSHFARSCVKSITASIKRKSTPLVFGNCDCFNPIQM